MMNIKKEVLIGVGIAAIAIAVFVWYQAGREKPKPVTTTGEAIQVLTETPSLGETVTPPSPVKKIPELNPIDITNPFKYENPLQ